MPYGVMDKALSCGVEGPRFKSDTSHFLFFSIFSKFKMAITSLGELGRTTNFLILIYMAIGSYHINKNFRLSPALCPILLSKSDIFGL